MIQAIAISITEQEMKLYRMTTFYQSELEDFDKNLYY